MYILTYGNSEITGKINSVVCLEKVLPDGHKLYARFSNLHFDKDNMASFTLEIGQYLENEEGAIVFFPSQDSSIENSELGAIIDTLFLFHTKSHFGKINETIH